MKKLKEGDIEEVDKFIFDKDAQYGLYAEIVLGDSIVSRGAIFHIVGFDEWCDEAIELAKKWLQREFDKFVPSEYQIWGSWIIKPPSESGEDFYCCPNGTVGWKYTPEKMRSKTLDCDRLVKAKS